MARADLRPLVVEGVSWGGLLQETTEVENYPGFRDGVLGPQLMSDMRDQAARFGARFISDDASAVTLGRRPGDLHEVVVGDERYLAEAVILSMGARHRKLGVPGETELGGRGVSYCATCDAAFFRGRDTCVIGGGDSAMEEALFLARFASSVTVMNRRSTFRASPIMLDRVRAASNVELLTPYRVTGFRAGDHGRLSAVTLVHATDGSRREVSADGAFVAIGHAPQSNLVAGQVGVDSAGYVQVQGRSTRTSVAGVFAAGDLVDHTYRQAITAAGSGCQAALDTQAYLRDHIPAALAG